MSTQSRGSQESSYHAGSGVASSPFWIATTATETDYPFGAGASRGTLVTFVLPTRPQKPSKHHHKKKHHHKHHRRK